MSCGTRQGVIVNVVPSVGYCDNELFYTLALVFLWTNCASITNPLLSDSHNSHNLTLCDSAEVSYEQYHCSLMEQHFRGFNRKAFALYCYGPVLMLYCISAASMLSYNGPSTCPVL